MKKVYVVWSVPDYIGIEIEGIFLDECQAKEFCCKLETEHYAYFGFNG